MPVRGSPGVAADTGTESKGSTGIQEVGRQDKGVLQDRVVLQVVLQEVRQAVLQGVRRDRQDRRELRGHQGVQGSETVEVLQTGRQVDQDRWEAWVHVEGSLLVPEVGVDEVVEDQSRRRRLRRRHRGLRQVVRDWVVEMSLREEVRSWEDFRTTVGAFQRKVPN